MALEWVQKNAEYFGGDSGRVTVMARGRGAQIVSILANQPTVTGKYKTSNQKLFKQMVLLSGSAYTPTLYADANRGKHAH